MVVSVSQPRTHLIDVVRPTRQIHIILIFCCPIGWNFLSQAIFVRHSSCSTSSSSIQTLSATASSNSVTTTRPTLSTSVGCPESSSELSLFLVVVIRRMHGGFVASLWIEILLHHTIHIVVEHVSHWGRVTVSLVIFIDPLYIVGLVSFPFRLSLVEVCKADLVL